MPAGVSGLWISLVLMLGYIGHGGENKRPQVSHSQRLFLESQGSYPVHVLFFVF